ncbi:hypothetical protein [Streptomyces sp. NRRL F-5123]|nr:hypothetical protein [Streptomyces sp. NRRL F-5123]
MSPHFHDLHPLAGPGEYPILRERPHVSERPPVRAAADAGAEAAL